MTRNQKIKINYFHSCANFMQIFVEKKRVEKEMWKNKGIQLF